MKEIYPVPVCLACGTPMTVRSIRKGERKEYSCPNCVNTFTSTKEALVCPVCFQRLAIVRENKVRIALCTDPKCPSFKEGRRGEFHGEYMFRTVKHSSFPFYYLDWNIAKNYFRFNSVVDFAFHDHLAEFVNKVIDAQGWNWKERPKLRRKDNS